MEIKLTNSQQMVFLKYASRPFPRHTSYPPANFWDSHWSPKNLIGELTQEMPKKISLYIHIPFCKQLCLYCGCNRLIVTDERRQSRDPTDAFIQALQQEMVLFAAQLPKNVQVEHIHLGGGTPTFLEPNSIEALFKNLRQIFNFSSDVRIEAEIDPRVTSDEHLQVFAEQGISRLSLGIQDFNSKVQKAINRIQPFEMVSQFVEKIRRHIAGTLNFDIIYGLPHQSLETMRETLAHVVALNPERISFFKLAYMPKMLKWQKMLPKESIPGPIESLEMFLFAIKELKTHGYDFLGLDHFVKESDPLHKAWREGKLRRNFQGMTYGEVPIAGLGPSAISSFTGFYSQNQTHVKTWMDGVGAGEFAVEKGFALSPEDLAVRSVIERLYCYGDLSNQALEKINLPGKRRKVLQQLAAEELLETVENGFRLTDFGRLLVRVVASVLDSNVPDSLWEESSKASPENVSYKASTL